MSKPYIINDANEMELLENYKIDGTPLIVVAIAFLVYTLVYTSISKTEVKYQNVVKL